MDQKSLIEKILKVLKSEYTQEYQSSELVRPTEKDHIINKLKVQVGRTFLTSINEYLDGKDMQEMNFYKFMERHIPLTDSMNPHRRPYSMREYFVDKNCEGNKLTHLEQLYDLTEINKDNELNLITINKDRGGIIHIGEKGSGKTFSQNVWLHETNDILEQNKIFWLRLDASKLLRIWEESDSLKNPNLITTEEYLLGQLVYVFCKHFIKEFPLSSPLFIEIAKKLSESEDNKIDKSIYKTKSQVDKSVSSYDQFTFSSSKKGIYTIIDVLLDLEKQIAKYEGFFLSDNRRKGIHERVHMDHSFLVDCVLVDSQKYSNDRYKGSKRDWMEIGKLLRRFIFNNGYFILFIIDGVDNINFRFSDLNDFIDKILNGLYEFPLKQSNSFNNELILLSLRDTTFESLKKLRDEKEYNDYDKHKDINTFHVIRQDTRCIQKLIFDFRVNYILKRINHNSFMSKVIMTILEYHNLPDESRWNSNIRCFLYNHLTLAKLITFRYYFANRPDNFNIKEQIDIFENINYFLNGELFVNEQVRYPTTNKGYSLFNLFGYVDRKTNNPNYFIYTRLLQYIKRCPNISERRLFIFTRLFGYENEDTNNCIDLLVSSGLIKSEYTPKVRERVRFTITPKGEFALTTFYSDIHFLYYSCLNTLLPDNVVNDLKVSPNNFPDVWSKKFYPPFCIITGITFLQYLHNINRDELEKAFKKKDGDEIRNNELPIDFAYLSSTLEKMIDLCFKVDEYRDLIIEHFTNNKSV